MKSRKRSPAQLDREIAACLAKSAASAYFKLGDIVRIRECKPVSKLKRWEVVSRAGEEAKS